MIARLTPVLRAKIAENSLEEVYADIELPMVDVSAALLGVAGASKYYLGGAVVYTGKARMASLLAPTTVRWIGSCNISASACSTSGRNP